MTQNVALQLYGRAIEICQSKSFPFLPYISRFKQLTVTEVHTDFIIPHPITDKGLTDFLSDVTTLLEEVRMSVATGKEETGAGRTWIALVSWQDSIKAQAYDQVNTDASDIALSATDYSPVELSYIKAVVSSTSYTRGLHSWFLDR
jgi:hypothetical protein